ncbi:MAG: metallophosphoesterase family protein [Thermodesulfobacteriota bacterium]
MRIYAVADIHADMLQIDMIRKNIEAHAPDVLVVAGDITRYIKPAPVLARLNRLPVPVFAVRGNSDPRWQQRHFRRYANIRHLHMDRVEIGGCCFAGIDGTIPLPFMSRLQWFERGMMDRIKPLIDCQTILVVHPPPRGTLDWVMGRFCAGARSVSELIADCRPGVVLCGHIHEAAGAACLDRTLVVNCSIAKYGHGALVDFDGTRPPVAHML